MALEVTNPGPDAFTFEEALHTYFAVRDVRNVTVTGLERTDYLDKVTGFDRKTQGSDPIRFTGETDRVYLNTTADCVIDDPGARRRIAIRKTGSDATVVWNPWIAKARAMPDFGDDEWPEMVCVETCNVNVHARTLAPGASHTMTAIIEVGKSRGWRRMLKTIGSIRACGAGSLSADDAVVWSPRLLRAATRKPTRR